MGLGNGVLRTRTSAALHLPTRSKPTERARVFRTAWSSGIERVGVLPSQWNGGKERPSDLLGQGRPALAEFQSSVTSQMRKTAIRRYTKSGLPPCSIDGLDARPRPARALGDLAILRLDEMARRRVPVQAA
jgi:hypothetical protein